jgi:hypothetical protein
MCLLVIGFALVGCVHQPAGQSDAGWITLFDGANLDNWTAVGKANRRVEDKLLQADKGSGHLVSKNSYSDFQIRAEFWVDADANSGIFIRCYGTGAIVNYVKVSPMPKAGGRWNTLEITAKGPQLTVVLNGTRTAEVQDSKHARGPFSIQYGTGVVKFRKVQIKPL